MADDVKGAWNDVGERFASFGKRVAERYQETGPTTTDAQESQRKLEEAAREITDHLGRAFTTLGDTLRDQEAKEALMNAVSSIGDAITVTVDEAGKAIKGGLGSDKGSTKEE